MIGFHLTVFMYNFYCITTEMSSGGGGVEKWERWKWRWRGEIERGRGELNIITN